MWKSRNLLGKVVFALTSGGTAFSMWIMTASETWKERGWCSYHRAVRDKWCDHHRLFTVALDLQQGDLRLPWLFLHGLNKWGLKLCRPSMAKNIYMLYSCLWGTLIPTSNTSVRLKLLAYQGAREHCAPSLSFLFLCVCVRVLCQLKWRKSQSEQHANINTCDGNSLSNSRIPAWSLTC